MTPIQQVVGVYLVITIILVGIIVYRVQKQVKESDKRKREEFLKQFGTSMMLQNCGQSQGGIIMSHRDKPIIIAATKKSEGGRGEYPVRYVVLKWAGWEKGLFVVKEYSRHMQVFDGIHDDYFIYGHYYCDATDALTDLTNSMKENNEDYHLGNVSHMPGMDFVDATEFVEGSGA